MHASRDATGSPDSSSIYSSDGDARQAAFGAMVSASASTSAAGASSLALDAACSESEHQRRRHRENMSRYRHKKKSVLEDMRVREQVLVAQVQSMLQLHASQSPTYEASEPEMRENAVLRHKAAVFQTFEDAVQEAMSAQAVAVDSRHAAGKANRAVSEVSSEDDTEPGYWIQFVENEALLYYVPLSHAQCRSMAAETMRQVFAFQTLNVRDKHPASAKVLRYFDWTASLMVEWGEDSQTRMMRYQFCKTFRHPARSVDE
ncbi:hypothetical protein PybrP1_000789, partial [[Pythium] brassicae (nom. inval.)]